MDARTETQTAARPDAPAAADPGPAAPDRVHPAIVGPALRTWLGYLVPLTSLSAIALSPLIAFALGTRSPVDVAGAKSVASLGWTLLAVAWLGQLVLVGGASAMTAGRPSQLRALGCGAVQLVRAVVPCLVAAAAIAIGSLALVIPGVILIVLLALTGASREPGLPAPLLDSIAAARRQWPAVAVAVATMFAIDAVIGLVSYRAFVAPLPRQPTPAQLAGARDFVRAVVAALVVVSPLPATVLATIRARATP